MLHQCSLRGQLADGILYLLMVTTLSVAAKSRCRSTVCIKKCLFQYAQKIQIHVSITYHSKIENWACTQSEIVIKVRQLLVQHRRWLQLQYGYQITVNLREEAWICKLVMYQSTWTCPHTPPRRSKGT